MSKKNKVLLLINICNLLILLGCVIYTRHHLIRKFNELTEKPIVEINLTLEEKLKDFEYFYDCIATSFPVDTLEEIGELYDIDFVGRYEKYYELVSATDNDLEFLAVMRAIGEEIPTFHAGLAYPDYEYYESLDCWNIDRILDKRGIRNKATYWNNLLKENCKEYLDSSTEIYRYSYNNTLGEYLDGNKEVLLAIDDMDIDYCVTDIAPQSITYDFIHQKAYRESFLFYDKPYSKTFAKETLIKIRTPEGKICEKTVYRDMVADVLIGYSKALGVTLEEEKKTTVADNMLYSYNDKERNVLYLNILSMNKWTLAEIPMILEKSDCDNIIIDLRKNGGGYFKSVGEYLYPSLFTMDMNITDTWYLPDTKYTKKMVTDLKSHMVLNLKKSDLREVDGLGNNQTYLESKREINWKGNEELDKEYNIYILISGETGSSADGFVGVLKENTSVTLVGTNTGGEGRMSSFLVDYLEESGLLYVYMPELGINADGSNNAVIGTSPHIYVEEGYLDEAIYEERKEDPYIYKNRLEWDNVLVETLKLIER